MDIGVFIEQHGYLALLAGSAIEGETFVLLAGLAQSMSHELGPKGIHVATVLIKGAIESERMRRNYPERMATIGPDDTLVPDDIAETYWQIHRPPRSAWSLEADLHPWTGK